MLENYNVKRFICILMIAICSSSLFVFIKLNVDFANYLCNITGIPKDLALSVFSSGFYNNILILLFTVELVLVVYICDKIYNVILD